MPELVLSNVDILKGLRVVICEDEAVTQMQMRRALTRAGMNVVASAFDGNQAIEAVLRERPDVVLMDIRMPKRTGLEAAREILAVAPVCVVILTAFSDTEIRAQAEQLGTSGYIVKPITHDLLLPCIAKAYARWLERSGSAER